jgi:uncharacterized protein YbjT (DUF2867 family)
MLLITGVNGYIGAHLAHRFRQEGRDVRGLVRQGRQEPQIDFLRSIGVDLVFADLEDTASWDRAMAGVRRVAHLIGSVQPEHRKLFEAMHVGLSQRCVAAAKASGVQRVVFLSAINARPGGISRYYDTKGRAEEVFRDSGIDYAIVRPALVCGRSVGHKDSKVMMKFVEMARSGSALKTVGNGLNRVQPIHIDDLTECFFQILTREDVANREVDLAGPEALTMNRMIELIAARAGCPDKPIRHVPRAVARMAAFFAERLSSRPILTTDQLRTMRLDMVADPATVPTEFGVTPRRFVDALADYFPTGEQTA